MWLTKQLSCKQEAREAEQGRVTTNENGCISACGAVDEKLTGVYAPYGFVSVPPPGERVLMIPYAQGAVCAGVLCDTAGLQSGEIRLISAGGARIVLKNNGDIDLNGVLITAEGQIHQRTAQGGV